MDKQYKDLMRKQNVDEKVTADFYEKLEKKSARRSTFRWRAVLTAACIALVIPITVFAVESIFGTAKVKLGKLDWHESPNGFSVRFDNLDSFPLDAFPEELQYFTDYKIIPCDSWEAAEETLGVDLLNNTFLAQAERETMRYSDVGVVHSKIVCNQQNGQLFYVGTSAHYRYEDIQLDLKAKLTVTHPELDEETKQGLLGVEGVTVMPADVKTSYEEYTTKEGIPVVILRWELDRLIHYDAIFAVDDISYELHAWETPEREADVKRILLDALDGFGVK